MTNKFNFRKYFFLRYGIVLIVAIWLSAIRTSYFNLAVYAAAIALVLAATANKKIGDVRVGIIMAWVFELPGSFLRPGLGGLWDYCLEVCNEIN